MKILLETFYEGQLVCVQGRAKEFEYIMAYSALLIFFNIFQKQKV